MKKVALLMGSETDRPLMEAALPYLEYFGLPHQVFVLSAHRNPEQVAQFAASAEEQGFGVLIAGAGMAAHLAGALKAHSILPVIGVPLPGGLADGLDAHDRGIDAFGNPRDNSLGVGQFGQQLLGVFCVGFLRLSKSLDFRPIAAPGGGIPNSLGEIRKRYQDNQHGKDYKQNVASPWRFYTLW